MFANVNLMLDPLRAGAGGMLHVDGQAVIRSEVIEGIITGKQVREINIKVYTGTTEYGKIKIPHGIHAIKDTVAELRGLGEALIAYADAIAEVSIGTDAEKEAIKSIAEAAK